MSRQSQATLAIAGAVAVVVLVLLMLLGYGFLPGLLLGIGLGAVVALVLQIAPQHSMRDFPGALSGRLPGRSARAPAVPTDAPSGAAPPPEAPAAENLDPARPQPAG